MQFRGRFWLVAGMVVSLIFGKGIAAAIAGRAFGYGRQARLTMWALTLPQVAATLAATLVGYKTLNAAGERLLAEEYSTRCWCFWSLPRFLGRS
jgi:Kef-type K+ transport system membrane component KefB